MSDERPPQTLAYGIARRRRKRAAAAAVRRTAGGVSDNAALTNTELLSRIRLDLLQGAVGAARVATSRLIISSVTNRHCGRSEAIHGAAK